jgi:phosphate butyryltransferase
MPLKNLNEILAKAKGKPSRRLVLVVAEDNHALSAVKRAIKEKIIIPILIGDKAKILNIAETIGLSLKGIEIIDEPIVERSVSKGISLIKQGMADIIMKGMLTTATFIRAIVDKENGLLQKPLLSHFALFETPYYHKLLAITDVAINICPDLREKVAILNNAIDILHRLGMENPKVAAICPVEVVNEKITSTVHASLLAMMNRRNQIKGCIIDGPLSLDNAISREAAVHKGIHSEVAGDPDLLLVHDLDSGNLLYKALGFLGGATSAAIVAGASVPVILTSRADSEDSKFMSIALAAAID